MPKRSAVRTTGGIFNVAIRRWQNELQRLVTQYAVLSALDGFLYPFRKKIADGTKRLDVLSYRWPKLQEAIDWLLGQQILTKDQLVKRIDAATKDQLGDFDIWAGSINEQLRNELAESVAAGESREEWRKRMQRASLGFVGNAEAIGRTWMHRSGTQGIKESLADPVVGELFPYWLYESTSDARTRPAHRAMGGKVAFRGSPLSAEMERLANEYGCRCTLVPITRDDAVEKGIDDDTGWVEPEEDSPAEVSFDEASEADRRDIDSQLRSLIGSTNASRLATVVGAPQGSAVNVTWNQSVSRVDIEHPKFQATLVLHGDEESTKWIEYEYLRVDSEHQGKGIGTDVAVQQILGAQKYGKDIQYVKLHAAGGSTPMEGFTGQYNGYYTWPRLGYDQPIALIANSDPDAFAKIRAKWPTAETVLDIMSTLEGRQWWKENGVELLDARFDLSPGSRSMQILEAYVNERAKRGQ